LRQKGVSAGVQAQIAGDSFNSLVLSTLRARDMHRAEPTVEIHPWLAPKYGDWGKGYTYLASGNASSDEVRKRIFCAIVL
jgi:hypothetical protein